MYMNMIWSSREKSSSRKLECLRSAGSLWKALILRRCDQKIRAVKLMYQVMTRLPVKIQKAPKLRKALFLLVSAIRRSKVSQTRDMRCKILWPELQPVSYTHLARKATPAIEVYPYGTSPSGKNYDVTSERLRNASMGGNDAWYGVTIGNTGDSRIYKGIINVDIPITAGLENSQGQREICLLYTSPGWLENVLIQQLPVLLS